MGNQGSASVTRNKYLKEEEVHIIQQSLSPGSLNRLPSTWEILGSDAYANLLTTLKGQDGTVSHDKYQNLAGDTLRGTLDQKIRFLGVLMGAKSSYTVKDIRQAFNTLFMAVESIYSGKSSEASLRNADYLSSTLLHDLIHPGQKRKNTVGKQQQNEDTVVEETDIERILNANPLVEHVIDIVVRKCFFNQTSNSSLPHSESFVSVLCLMFLNFNIPHEYKDAWRPVFSIRRDGESFSKFAASIMNRGATIIIIKDNEGNVYGGFSSESWKLGPNFFGKSDSFLFHLQPCFNIYDSTPFNKNYQYFNLKQKTMPNGLGQGGQLEYFGYWIDSDFGIVRTSPSCTTFHSPQLGAQEGKIEELEVWGVGPEPDIDELGPGVLNVDPEVQAVMEMMGKTLHSKAIREVDKKQEELKKLEEDVKSQT